MLNLNKIAKLLDKYDNITSKHGDYQVISADDDIAILAPRNKKHVTFKNMVAYSNRDDMKEQLDISGIKKVAAERSLSEIDKALEDPIAREVAKMLATSHEYKTPNIDGALAIVKNYKWEKSTEKISNLEGINKPVNKEKVFNIAEGIKKNKSDVNPFIVVNKLNGIYPQTLGKKLLLDGHHRKEACEMLGMKEVPIYKGTFTGGAQKPKEELREKTASEKDIYYHASPVQDIKKFRHSVDTSGNNKGKVVFASKEPSFTVAFGTRWNDGIARMHIETKDNKPPNEDNYIKTILKYTDKVNVEAPCSMYKIKGEFEPLRYEKDLEVITNKDVEIVSEEKFKNFKDMAKFYGLDLRYVTEDHILSKLKGKKSSNFEKKALTFNKEQFLEKLSATVYGVEPTSKIKQLDNKVEYEKKKKNHVGKINARQNITENTTSNISTNSIDINGVQGIKSSIEGTGNYINQNTDHSQGIGNIAQGVSKILKTK